MMAVVKNFDHDKLERKFVIMEITGRRSGFVCRAPTGFGPGDEKFLKVNETPTGPSLIIDWLGHAESKKAKDWNQKSFLGRIGDAVRS